MPDLLATKLVSSCAGPSEPLRRRLSNWPSFFAPFGRMFTTLISATWPDIPSSQPATPAEGESSPDTPWRDSRVTKCRGHMGSTTFRRSPEVPPRPVEIIRAHLLKNSVFFALFGQAFTISIRSTGSDPTTRGLCLLASQARPRDDSTGPGTVGLRRANPVPAVEKRGLAPAQVDCPRELAVPAGACPPCSTRGQARSPATIPASPTPHHTPRPAPHRGLAADT